MQFARSCTLFCHFLPLLFVVQFSFKLSLSCGSRSGLGKRGPRKPLMLQQCVPDVFEQSQQASGPAKGKITRNSQDFAKLKANYNSAIVFQDEESTGADRLMSTRCKEKLNTLGNLVKDQWPNIKLVVTEAWDENDKHSKNSLHYEGRAVDLRLSDKDMPKIGLLGRLAIDAGFDWVCYEDRNHIHASVREDGYKDKTWDGCFSADSTVQLENNVDIAIDKLKIGDKVQVLKPNGRVGYSEVMMFADFKPRSLHARHVMIETEKPAKRITLTPNHLIYVKENNDSDTTQLKTKHAAFVSPGEYVLVSLYGQLLASRVKSVSLVKLTGMVAPVTMEGNIVVDGVLASCYAMIHDHNIAHLAFGPLRLAHNFVPNLWNTDSSIQDGMHWYAEMLMWLNRLLNVVQLS